MFGKLQLLLVFIFALSGCSDPNYAHSDETFTSPQTEEQNCQAQFQSQHCVVIDWVKPPSDAEYAEFIFKTYRPNRADGTPVLEDLEGLIKVQLWMPDMGHGSSPVRVEKLDIGTYRASQVFFSMRGKWEVRFQLKEGTSVKDQATYTLIY